MAQAVLAGQFWGITISWRGCVLGFVSPEVGYVLLGVTGTHKRSGVHPRRGQPGSLGLGSFWQDFSLESADFAFPNQCTSRGEVL